MTQKPQIRLPEDDEYGPNPYDSKTTPADLTGNKWLVSWRWWIGAFVFAAFWGGWAWWKSKS